MTRKSGRLVLLGGVLAVPVLLASLAYACVSLATLSLDKTSGNVGETVTGTGKGFSGMMGAVGTNVPATQAQVEVHFGSRNGQIVWSGLPNSKGEVNFSFQVPDSAAGENIVFATQTTANGNATSGTPARVTFTVNAPVAEPTPAVVAPAEQAPVAQVAPASAPAAGTRPAVRTRVAPPARVTPAPAPAAAPAPAVTPTPAVEATPAPVAVPAAPAPAVEAAPAPTPVRRSVMVSMASSSDGSPALAIALVGIGLVLALGASAVVLSGRRGRKAPAGARR